jgi:hypothetical protein
MRLQFSNHLTDRRGAGFHEQNGGVPDRSDQRGCRIGVGPGGPTFQSGSPADRHVLPQLTRPVRERRGHRLIQQPTQESQAGEPDRLDNRGDVLAQHLRIAPAIGDSA